MSNRLACRRDCGNDSRHRLLAAPQGSQYPIFKFSRQHLGPAINCLRLDAHFFCHGTRGSTQ